MSRYVLLCGLLLLAGCKPVPAPPPVGNPSAQGWEIRYNAVLALAHRGAPAFTDPATLEVMTELLDEKQQLSNFRLTRKDGSVVANPPAARMCLLGGLNAIVDYKKLRADADLSALRPALEKLGTSSDPGVAKEARVALEQLAPRK